MISMSVPLKLVAEAHIKGARYEKQNNHSAEDEIIHTAKNLALLNLETTDTASYYLRLFVVIPVSQVFAG